MPRTPSSAVRVTTTGKPSVGVPAEAEWLTTAQVAAKFQLALRTVKRRIQDGSIPSRLIGGTRRVHRSVVGQANESEK